jgi:hypothetical protein
MISQARETVELLKLAIPETQPDWKSGYARDVRKYLGMKLT